MFDKTIKKSCDWAKTHFLDYFCSISQKIAKKFKILFPAFFCIPIVTTFPKFQLSRCYGVGGVRASIQKCWKMTSFFTRDLWPFDLRPWPSGGYKIYPRHITWPSFIKILQREEGEKWFTNSLLTTDYWLLTNITTL